MTNTTQFTIVPFSHIKLDTITKEIVVDENATAQFNTTVSICKAYHREANQFSLIAQVVIQFVDLTTGQQAENIVFYEPITEKETKINGVIRLGADTDEDSIRGYVCSFKITTKLKEFVSNEPHYLCAKDFTVKYI